MGENVIANGMPSDYYDLRLLISRAKLEFLLGFGNLLAIQSFEFTYFSALNK